MTIMKTITLTMNCPFCGSLHQVTVGEDAFEKYVNGALASKAFPQLTATEREQIISEICPKCQSKFFEEDPEEDEDEGDDIYVCMQESLNFTGQWW